MRRGFTLLELLVASLLLALLVSILTMIFNQSSIAWATGRASVVALGDVRRDISRNVYLADNVLATEGSRSGLQVVTLWDPRPSGTAMLRTDTGNRAVDLNGLSGMEMRDPLNAQSLPLGGGTAEGSPSYVVGVSSDGPDGIAETWDDISTFPEDQL